MRGIQKLCKCRSHRCCEESTTDKRTGNTVQGRFLESHIYTEHKKADNSILKDSKSRLPSQVINAEPPNNEDEELRFKLEDLIASHERTAISYFEAVRTVTQDDGASNVGL
jgi:hypothetical protein